MPLDKTIEKELIEGCRRNDRISQEKLYKHFQGKMLALCLRYTGDRETAMEMMNLGFLKVFTKIDRYGYNGSFEGWIRTIMVRVMADEYKRNLKYNENIVLDERDAMIDDDVVAELQANDIRAMIAKLPPAMRMIFNLFAVEGYTHEEIAGMLDINTGTSKSQLFAARKKLQAMLKKSYNPVIA